MPGLFANAGSFVDDYRANVFTVEEVGPLGAFEYPSDSVREKNRLLLLVGFAEREYLGFAQPNLCASVSDLRGIAHRRAPPVETESARVLENLFELPNHAACSLARLRRCLDDRYRFRAIDECELLRI